MSRAVSRRARCAALVSLMAGATGVAAQQFGGSAAIGADRILIGEAGQQILPGIVYVYGQSAGAWSELGRISVADENGAPDGFGRAMSASGWLVLVGAPLENGRTGAAYVLRPGVAGAWETVARLEARDSAEGATFGSAVSLMDGVALVAAPGAYDGAGAVYVFERGSGDAWTETDRLRAGEAGGRAFGSTMARGGDVLLVGSQGEDGQPGAVHVFESGAGAWNPRGALIANGLGERSRYGAALGVRDGVAFVGAPGVAGGVGTVLVFRYDQTAGEWVLGTRLGPLVADPFTSFGSSIAFDGADVLVGAPGSSSGGGAMYRFERNAAGAWSSSTMLTHAELEGRAGFGGATWVEGDLAVIGATSIDGGAGSAVLYARSGGGWSVLATVENEMRGFPAITGGEVECERSHVAGFECSDVNIASFLPIKDIGGARGTMVNDIWGWVDPDTGREYAIVGRSDGTAFVDISDPYDPRYLGNLPKTEGSQNSVWRDMKVYRDHVYVVADAALEHGVQVFDLRQLRDVRGEAATFEPTYVYDGINSAHNIVINEASGYAYAVGSSGGGETCGGGLHMISLEDPARPVFAGCFAQEGTGRGGTGYSHDAQCVVYHGPDADHRGKEICLGSNETALNIADVANKDAPVTISTVSYPNVAYAHQGWLSEDHRFFYMNDEGDEGQGLVAGTRTLVWDVTDLDDPVLVKEYIAATTTTDHNLYIRGDTMYQSNYGSGLRILDISQPDNPVEIGFLDTTPYGGGGSWSNYPYFPSGVIVATSMGDGLFVLKSTARRLVP